MRCPPLFLLLALTACSPSRYVDSADREVGELLRDFDRRVLADRQSSVAYPVLLPPPPVEQTSDDPFAPVDTSGPAEPESAESVQILDLDAALELAVENGRDFVSRRETLYLAGLGFSSVRFAFGPQFDATLNLIYGDQKGGPRTYSLQGSTGVSQILPTGGILSVDAGLGTTRFEGPHFGDPDRGRGYESDISIRLSQPLLRGAGYDVSHESLVQAERDLVYALRDFELFRQDYSITISSTYYDLVNQKKSLSIQQQRTNDARRDYQKALALRQVDRNKKNDIFVARRAVNQAENELLDAETDFKRSLDQFAIDLGLPRRSRIDVVESDPPFEPVHYEPASAVEVALRNRLDIATQRDQVEDVARSLRLAENDFLPDLGLDLAYAKTEQSGLEFRKGLVGAGTPWTSSAAVSLRIPIQQTRERNSYVQSQIAMDRARRDYEQFVDTQVASIEDQLRQLERTQQQIVLQRELILEEQESIDVVQFLLETGEASNRDLAEARRSVDDARNQLNRLLSDHFIGRLTLTRSLGILFVDEKGRWR